MPLSRRSFIAGFGATLAAALALFKQTSPAAAEQDPPVTQDDFSVRVLPHRERDKRAAARARYTHVANYLPPGTLSEERKDYDAHIARWAARRKESA